MIAIIKYNGGNVCSIQNAISRLGYKSIVTDDVDIILKADKVIFPGVGEAGSAMAYLKSKGLDKVLVNIKQPLLGICLGLQLMCTSSEEGNTSCLNIFNTKVKKFSNQEIVPHMGWNNQTLQRHKLFNNIKEKDHMYYVHSYYAEPCNATIALGDYIQPFSAVMQKDNFYACQFHPEKSGKSGEQFLKNFLEL